MDTTASARPVNDAPPSSLVGDVAIVGCGLRLPGKVDSLHQLWRFLLARGDAIRDLPAGRWLYDLYDPQRRPGRSYVRRAGYIDNLDLIDISFLGCSPREAGQVDPQQRLLIETAFEALENAGVPLESIAKTRTGVFVGISSNDHGQTNNEEPRRINAFSNTGGALSIAANRISYVFDLRGPSMAVDTACSSGLTALDLAVRSIRQRACDMAIVGAANALLRPEPFAGFCAAQMLSPVGQCRAFDADGEGFVRAEGAAAFVLKPLEAALRCNDPILGVVVGTGANNDGRTGGLSLPNGDAQAELIDRVFREHDVCADDVAYVEAHGTGTAVGDPIEAGAIGQTIAQARSSDSPLFIGSIKTNVGHLEPAAGLAGLAKAILCLQHRQIPPSLHFDTPNPAIDFEGLRIKVVDDLVPLPATPGQTLVAVNSFGFGGANAHAVVAEPPPPASPEVADLDRPWFMVSGRSAGAMRAAAARLSEHLADNDQVSLYELSANLLTRRTWHPHRTAIWADDVVELQRALDAVAAENEATNAVSGTAGVVGQPAFIFTGNGPQWWGMGRGLYDHSATFRDTLEEVDAIFRAVADLRLVDEMMRSEADSRMAMTEIAQPALFALQLGLVRCLAEDGLFPGAAVGHSAGELAAAYCAGLFDLETIIRVVAARSHEQGKTAGAGAMAAIGLGIDEATKVLESYDGLVLAGYNAPDALTTAGPVDAIDALIERLEATGAFAKKLQLNYAFHSPAMDPVEAAFRASVCDVRGHDGTVPFYSTVTGTRLDGETMDVDYWWRNVRDPVMFRPAIDAMCADGHGVFVEVGPHPNLLGYAKAIGRVAGKTVRGVETLRRGADEHLARRKTIAAAAVAGSVFDFATQFHSPVRKIPLPTYPWQHESYINRPDPRASLSAHPSEHAFLGSRIWVAKDLWHQQISLSKLAFLGDHVIRDTVLFPATGFLELAIAAGRASGVDETLELRSVQIEKALPLDPEREVELQTFVDRVDHGVSVRSRVVSNTADTAESEPEPFVEHMRAVLRNRPRLEKWVDIDALRIRLQRGTRSRDEHYALAASRGLNYGPDFQTVEHVDVGDDEVLAVLTRRNAAGVEFTLDPTQLDGALQVMIGLIETTRDRRLFIPVHLDRLVLHGSTKPLDTVLAHVVARGANRFYLTADITLLAPDGNVVAELVGMQVRSVGAATGASITNVHHALMPIHLFDQALPVVDLSNLIGDMSPSPAAGRRRRLASSYTQHLDEVCAAFTGATFRALSGGKAFKVDELASDGRVASRHVGYASALLDHAVAAGFVEATESGELKVMPAPDALELWQSYAKLYPQYSSEWFLAARIGLHQEALLRADRELFDLLFAGSTSPIVEQIYDQGFAFVEANAALASAVAAYVEHLPATQPLRILEVGGGTGGTTAHVLNALDLERVDYVFSDIATEFLAGAERRFLNVPSFETAGLDLANGVNVAALGGPFDVVVAANVLHATSDVRRSIRKVNGLLKPNGLFGMIEPARRGYLDFLFGLLPGTWQFGDCSVRSEHPLLPSTAWLRVVREEGFDDAVAWSDPAGTDAATSCLVLARASGHSGAAAAPSPQVARSNRGQEREAWLIVAMAGGAGEFDRELATRLRAQGDVASVVHITCTDEANGARSVDGEVLDGRDESAWWTVCQGLRNAESTRVVFVAPRTSSENRPNVAEGWPLVAFVKAVNTAEWSTNPRLFLVTENVLADADVNVAGGCYWAVGRAIVNEQPGWTCRRVDHDGSPEAKRHLVDWLTADAKSGPGTDDNVDEVRFTADGMFANVIKPVHMHGANAVRTNGTPVPFAVTLTAQGSIDNLIAKQVRPTRRLDPGTVEVALKAAGLNFKDVILALGMLPPELLRDSEVGPLMGLEGAGEVVRVGAGVTTLAPGDNVMLMAEGTFASSIVVPEHAARKIPQGWSHQEAATLPVVGLTVLHALKGMAQLRRGEVLLVHGGAGGIGLLAIQYAKAVGATVIATAGSPEKRDLLRTLGVDCVSDSRTLRFEEDARAYTQGEGVDVVLNSLAGDAMFASLDVLKPFGRFVEIGKRDFEANNRLHLKALERNISYFAVDLTFLPHQRPQLYTETWDRLIEACEARAIEPLPFRTYALSGLKEAMRSMQAGRHVGKLILDLEKPDVQPAPLPPQPVRFTGKGVHLITGGLGGIGLKLAHWIAERGARTIALVGRNGVTNDDQVRAIEGIEALGAQVVVAKADVADADAMTTLVADLVRDYGAISGLIHSVLVLDDQLMTKMTQDAFVRVMRPKVEGAYHVHRLTRDQPMDYFIVFSSLANLFGNPGQANYVAANAYLEQLVLSRRAAGLPGLALALAAVSDVGVIQRDETVRANLNQAIGGSITFADIPAALDGLLREGPPVATVIELSGRPTAPIMATARVEALLGRGGGQHADSGETIDFVGVAPEERAERMMSVLVEAVARVTGAKESRVDAERSFTDLGLDSLMTVEFAAGVERRLGVSVPRPELGPDRNLKDLAAALLKRLNLEVTEASSSGGTRDEERPELELMERDATLPDDFVVEQQPGAPRRLAECRAVFLTGATGFLGAFLLDEILRKDVRRVVCLGRGRDDWHARERLLDVLGRAGLDEAAKEVGRRVEVWQGDFAADDLGLSEARLADLTETVDVILHSGADVSFIDGYAKMRAANVLSTRHLLEIARRGCPTAFHFVSTLRTYADIDQIRSTGISETVMPALPPEREGGYVKTKWVADVLAHGASARGLRVGVYRPSFVIGRTTDGYSNVSDLGSALLKYAFDSGTLPDVDVSCPVVPVDVAARRIVAFMNTPGEQFGTRHVTDWPALSMGDIARIVSANGLSIRLLPVDEFIDRSVEFFRANPGHPALWLPAFFSSGASDNPLGDQLQRPVLPSAEGNVVDESRATVALMVRWFRSLAH